MKTMTMEKAVEYGLNEKIEEGDTVEILDDADPYLKCSIGLQGVVMWGINDDMRVKLPIDIMGDNIWIYSIENLKLIRKASKTL